MKFRRFVAAAAGSVLVMGILASNRFCLISESKVSNPESEEKMDIVFEQEEEKIVAEEMEAKTEIPTEHIIDNFTVTLQMPELPTGCEITALTMVLNYYGFYADKVVMAEEYLPTVPANLYYDSDGWIYGPDLNRYFAGDPKTNGGYVCGVEAIRIAANNYLNDQGSSIRAVDLTGASTEELYRLNSEDTPVVVWVTIYMEPRQRAEGWYTEEGNYVDWSTNDHGAVLVGYSENTVTIADPISGLIEYSRQAFEEVFSSRGRQCLILEAY